MKKQLLIISIIVVIVSIFVSCSANSSSEAVSTTAVTDSNGTTHYYEPVADNKAIYQQQKKIKVCLLKLKHSQTAKQYQKRMVHMLLMSIQQFCRLKTKQLAEQFSRANNRKIII